MNATAPPARLKIRYLDEIRPDLIERFGYTTPMQAPKLEKITLNMGLGSSKQDSKGLKAAQDQLATIAGQRPSVRRARKSIAAFKLREGMPVGIAVTLRGERAYEFLDRLISIAIPRIRDFRGLSARSFDGRGNYSLGVREQIIFPEIDYDAIDEVRGLDITITTSAASDPEAYALLASLGMPYTRQGMPKRLQELADDGLGPAADAAATGRRPQPAPASDEAPQETAQAAEPAAEPELPVGDASEPDLASAEAPEQGLAVEDASELELSGSDAPESDAEASASATVTAEAPDATVANDGDDPSGEATAVGDSADASDGVEEPVSDEAPPAGPDGESVEASVASEAPPAGPDGESVEASVASEALPAGPDGESVEASVASEAPPAGPAGDNVEETVSSDPPEDAAGDDSNDTEDAD
jgi:large subunit ribosomal protein L5